MHALQDRMDTLLGAKHVDTLAGNRPQQDLNMKMQIRAVELAGQDLKVLFLFYHLKQLKCCTCNAALVRRASEGAR